MYIAAGQGQITQGDKILMSTDTLCHLGHLLQVSKKSLWSLILYNFFLDFTHVYSAGAGADSPLKLTFWCQQEHLVTSVTCCKFQKHLFKVWFYTFFSWFYTCIPPWQGQTGPRGQRFDVNRNVLSLYSLQVSKTCLWSLIYYNCFHDLIHVYSLGTGADGPLGTKFWCQLKGLITLPICCKFQGNLFEVWFYTILFMI